MIIDHLIDNNFFIYRYNYEVLLYFMLINPIFFVVNLYLILFVELIIFYVSSKNYEKTFNNLGC